MNDTTRAIRFYLYLRVQAAVPYHCHFYFCGNLFAG